jgi:hypothetical protein
LYQPGLPPYVEITKSASFDRSTAAARSFAAGELAAADIPVHEWSPHAVVNLVNSLPMDVTGEQLSELDAALGLSASQNAEIGRAWFTRVARMRHTPAYGQLEQHLNRYGRTWLLQGVYRSLVDNGVDGELARSFFEKARSAYHPLTVRSIEPLLPAE